jgi:hypothetical protein
MINNRASEKVCISLDGTVLDLDLFDRSRIYFRRECHRYERIQTIIKYLRPAPDNRD